MTESFNLIKKLVEDFKQQESAYLRADYSEQRVREDYINKFFTYLGWDVTHEVQKNPYEQEVKIENPISTGGSQRRADYAFYVAPNFRDVKFFVEAKKPSRNLANADDYYQTIRYGWNQKTPVAILTDFEEFHILDCRYKPDIKTTLERKIEVFHCTDYADEEKFRRIYYLFGRDEAAKGSIEKYSASLPSPKGKAAQKGFLKSGYQPVDEAFLEQLDEYREILAKAFKNKNPDLDGEELTETVQRIIDRLVFIRFLEDKSIEDSSIIHLAKKSSAWKAFLTLCKSFEPKYNGLVFKPHRIIDSPDFHPPDNKAFADICSELADPTSPYDFDKIPISILGSIYERFLGKVVNTTDKRAKVVEKPEVRKAGGVYYTPEYIVRYIVNETVGKLIEGKTPEEISQMAFADIACGSGSFLIEVYNLLLEYHSRYYAANPGKARKGDIEMRDGEAVLSLKKRQQILVNNIYGVDIDFQATEVTQLSLYLKLLEDVTMNDAFQFSLLKEKILPDLKNNIVCGNSLIGTDIMEGKLFAGDEERKLNPMNFEDAFPHIMKRGGFDAIVGNPPYVRIQQMKDASPIEVEFYKKKYAVARYGNYDIYVVFVERALKFLNSNGLMGYILPHKFFNAKYGESLRNIISKGKHLTKVVHFNDQQVFNGATTYTCLMFLSKSFLGDFKFISIRNLDEWKENRVADEKTIKTDKLSSNEWNFNFGMEFLLSDKIKCPHYKLGDIAARIFQGLVTGADFVFIVRLLKEKHTTYLVYSKALDQEIEIEKYIAKPLLKGSEIRRYLIEEPENIILFPYRPSNGKLNLMSEPELKNNYPLAWQYFLRVKKLLEAREGGKWHVPQWWQFGRSQNISEMSKKKILTQVLAKRGSFIIDKDARFCFVGGGNAGGYGLYLKEKLYLSEYYLLGLLNSKLLDYYLKSISTQFRGGYYSYARRFIENLPIRQINFSDPSDKSRHDNIVNLVEQMLSAKQKQSAAKTDGEINKLELQIASLDRKIDDAVYELYGLSEEEIRVVEGELPK